MQGGLLMERILKIEQIDLFKQNLIQEEKSVVTVEKYLRDIHTFFNYVGNQVVDKELVIQYKHSLIENKYAARSINSMLASLNKFFLYLSWSDLKIKGIRSQKEIFCAEEKELTKEEYTRLLKVAGEKTRLNLLLQTICSTGVRVSEVSYFTVEAVKRGEIIVSCKNKTRIVLIPGKLRKKLLKYARTNRISEGIIFRTRNGNPLNRSNIWAEMKKLCEKAGVNPKKVFPHNLRKLFARTFYKIEKDIAKLADILGHSNINTTRIYIVSTGVEHRRKIERMGLVI